MKYEIEWVERTLREIEIEVDSIEELSDFEPILGEGKGQWRKLEDNSIKFKKVLDDK